MGPHQPTGRVRLLRRKAPRFRWNSTSQKSPLKSRPEMGPPKMGFDRKRWGDRSLIFLAERSGLPVRLERHCRHAEIRAGWPTQGTADTRTLTEAPDAKHSFKWRSPFRTSIPTPSDESLSGSTAKTSTAPPII